MLGLLTCWLACEWWLAFGSRCTFSGTILARTRGAELVFALFDQIWSELPLRCRGSTCHLLSLLLYGEDVATGGLLVGRLRAPSHLHLLWVCTVEIHLFHTGSLCVNRLPWINLAQVNDFVRLLTFCTEDSPVATVDWSSSGRLTRCRFSLVWRFLNQARRDRLHFLILILVIIFANFVSNYLVGIILMERRI